MTTPAEITVTVCVAVAIAVGTMFVMPRPKPEPPTAPAPARQERPVNQTENAKAAAPQDLVTQSTGENVPIEGQPDRLKLLELRLLAIDAQVKRIEEKADEQAPKRRN